MGEFGLSGLQRFMLGQDSIHARTVGILLDVNPPRILKKLARYKFGGEEYSSDDSPAREYLAYFRGTNGPS